MTQPLFQNAVPADPIPGRQLWPSADDQTFWQSLLTDPLKKEWVSQIMAAAENIRQTPIPETRLNEYCRFRGDGDRVTYEHAYFARRQRLGLLVLAITFYPGREDLFPPLLDHLWAILGEPYWGIPAHADYLGNDPFPAPTTSHKVELFSAATGNLLALTMQLLGSRLHGFSPVLTDFIHAEIRRRLLDDFAQTPEDPAQWRYWWFSGRNNWTPWCAANLLGTALVFARDSAQLAAILRRLAAIMDRYYEQRPADGYCDEGPSYWQVSIGPTLFYAEWYERAWPGRLAPLFQDDLFRRMAAFIADLTMGDDYLLSFSDSAARASLPPGLLCRLAERLNLPQLQALAAQTIARHRAEPYPESLATGNGETLHYALYDLFCCRDGPLPPAPPRERCLLFAQNAMTILRSDDDRVSASLKGGHNGECHNHNDLGHFTLFADNQPLIIDTGTAQYSRIHFSDQRYTLWTHNASGHNGLIFSTASQKEGRDSRTPAPQISHSGSRTVVSLDLSRAYPAETNLVSYTRSLELPDTGLPLTITDTFACRQPVSAEIHLLTPQNIAPAADGSLCFSLDGTPRFRLSLSGWTLGDINNIPLTDEKLQKSWGASLNQVVLHCLTPCTAARLQLRFERL